MSQLPQEYCYHELEINSLHELVGGFFMNLLPDVSDEELFSMSAQGNVFAHDVLFHRYERIGRQIAGSFVRVNKLYGMTDQDFIEQIEDGVAKVFRYYNYSFGSFYVYCRAILNQSLATAVGQAVDERCKTQNAIQLDASISESGFGTYHELVADKDNVDSSSQIDLNKMFETLSSPSKSKNKTIIKVIMLSIMGYSRHEISCKTQLSYYLVRKILENPNDTNINVDVDINMH